MAAGDISMRDSIIIIGAGMGGLAAGIYGRLNGYRTQVFEMHSLPGGQCTSWKRRGYTFDACIHHLFGCSPASRIFHLWEDIGAMPRDLVPVEDCVSVASPDGRLFKDYYDLDKLEAHLAELAPADGRAIRDYVAGIRAFVKNDFIGVMMMGSAAEKLAMVPSLAGRLRWFKPTMARFAERFSDPFLKRAFRYLIYSAPENPLVIHLARHALGLAGAVQWPVGGALTFSRSIEARYKALGGEVRYNAKVEKILVENGRAVGVRLADGSEHRADVVISDADGRKTILDMLDGRFIDDKIRAACAEPPDVTNWSAHVFLGVNRDLSAEPSALVMLLDGPVTIAGHAADSLEMQIYGFDRTMAPPNKGVIKVELVSSYAHWKALAADRAKYEAEKSRTADAVIAVLEKRFPGLAQQVEAVDVPTQMTWERYMNGTHGFANFPTRKSSIWRGLSGSGGDMTLPGLANFRFVGVWASMAGSLFGNALSGRRAIESLCKEDGKRFTS